MFGIVIVNLIPTNKQRFIRICNESSLAVAAPLFGTHPILSISVNLCANVRESTACDLSRSPLTSNVVNWTITVFLFRCWSISFIFWFRFVRVEWKLVHFGCCWRDKIEILLVKNFFKLFWIIFKWNQNFWTRFFQNFIPLFIVYYTQNLKLICEMIAIGCMIVIDILVNDFIFW